MKEMLLDPARLRAKGWKPRYDGKEAVRLTARSIEKRGLAHKEKSKPEGD